MSHRNHITKETFAQTSNTKDFFCFLLQFLFALYFTFESKTHLSRFSCRVWFMDQSSFLHMGIHPTSNYIKCDLKVMWTYKWPGMDKNSFGKKRKTKGLILPDFNIYYKDNQESVVLV